MVRLSLGQEGTKLLEDGLDEVRWECGHGARSFCSGSLEDSPNDGASVSALHVDSLPIDGSSYVLGSHRPDGGGKDVLLLPRQATADSLRGYRRGPPLGTAPPGG